MIKITPDHEEIANFILSEIEHSESHYVDQQKTRDHFLKPYRLREYDTTLRILLEHNVIKHDNGDRLTPSVKFNQFKSIKRLIKPIDTKFWVATSIGLISVLVSVYFGYRDNQKSKTIEDLNGKNKELLISRDSLSKQSLYLDSLLKKHNEVRDSSSKKTKN